MTVIFWIFAVLIMLAPLPFGMVHEVVQALFACIVFSLAAVLCIYHIGKGRPLPVPIRRVILETAAFATVIGWALFQMSPFTPAALHHPLWAEAGHALGQELAGAISLSPGSGFQSVIRLATYAFVFWLALQLGRDRRRARLFIDIFILVGTLYAAYGIMMEVEGIRKVLWVDKDPSVTSVSGTFVNRNTFATYTGLILLCAAGAYSSRFLELACQGKRGRDRLVAFWNTALIHGAPRLASILILLSALFLSGSRAGAVFSLSAILIFLVFYGMIRSTYRRFSGFVAGALLAALLIAAVWHGDLFFLRLSVTDLEQESRLQAYFVKTQQAIKSAPFTGFGLGSFERAFPLYSDARTSQLDKAHNDWLEMIFELGWPAALLWFGILVSLAIRCFAGFFRRERDHIYPLAGFCGALLVGMHAFVDFSLQMPAVAATFSALLGIGVAQSRSSRE